jgi:hypothetical protein
LCAPEIGRKKQAPACEERGRERNGRGLEKNIEKPIFSLFQRTRLFRINSFPRLYQLSICSFAKDVPGTKNLYKETITTYVIMFYIGMRDLSE